MLILLVSSVASFLAMFFALLTLLRRAAAPRSPSHPASHPPRRRRADLPDDLYSSLSNPLLPAKRPDWRFLVRGRKRTRSTSLWSTIRPTSPQTSSPILASDGALRSDWAYFHEDLGDLQDPTPDSLPLARRA